ncbi:M23 family metallopeptidase [Blastococcus sp. KM273128]|uniref:M23 family metallopeptidase n=1 Tax=Blastococcus sp. KM273128 TaxID=2570314 RepID=UPI001F18C22E|nr:M23 family metallopeptidase [Blastococcus sp. KM273128]MCF6743917.1 M23 family metallopeptidase [Blastococcus sp. KM273128]
MSPRRAAARVRPLLPAPGVLLIASDGLGLPAGPLLGFLLIVGFVVLDRVAPPPAPVRVVEPPVDGAWRALNSPATKVPSHGTHGLGQTWALDLVAEPADGTRPAFGSGGQWRPVTDYPAFGLPVRSPVAGRVVRAHDRRSDHRARSGWLSLVYLLTVEGFVRQVAGARWMLGNHVVVETDDGTCAVLAHLRRGSVRVAVGERVAAGQQVAECGNSGNSSEPHLHVQLTDSAWVAGSCGRPMAFRGGAPGGADGLPADQELLGAR